MSLGNLVRVGRHWINPRYLVRVEDLAHRECGAEKGAMLVVMAPGEGLTLGCEDADELRRLLGVPDEGGSVASTEDAPPGTPRTLSGYGPAPLVQRDPHVGDSRSISE